MRLSTLLVLTGLLACALLTAPAARADLGFNVTLDTSGLAGGPFSILFQLTEGDATPNNTVTINNITFGGGSVSGSPLLFGGASGSLASTVVLTDLPPTGDFFNEFEQGFTPGSLLSFDVHMTTNFAGGALLQPDSFGFSIPQLPTESPAGAFVQVDITGPNTAVQKFASTAPGLSGLTPTVTIPEPGTIVLAASGLLPMLGMLTKRRRA